MKSKTFVNETTAKKRVAIMTWYTYMNYGSALQAYALKHTINKMGYLVDFVNYNPSLAEWEKKPFSYSGIFATGKNFLHDLVVKPDFSNYDTDREQLYLEFRHKYFTETESVQSPQELHSLNSKYDAFVCGSDQVWSPLCFDPSYYLDFVDLAEKKIAYAPSMGTDNIKESDIKKYIKSLLDQFAHLSCREDVGAKLIESLTGKRCEHVLDPTLLLDANEWGRVANKSFETGSEKYCLAYFLGDNKTNWSLAKFIAKSKGLDLLLVPVSGRDYKKQEAISSPVGPEELLNLFWGADYICTDSYHGLLFSINFKKDFSVFNRFSYSDSRSQNSRIDSCLEMFDLKWRKVAKRSDFLDKPINYDDIDARLKQQKMLSLDYLRSSLQSAVMYRNELEEKRSYLTNTCIGCGACETICPTGAINFKTSPEGFEHALIDEKKCISCKKCSSVCPLHKIRPQSIDVDTSVYAFRCSEEDITGSSSGGFAWAAGDYCAKRGLDVFGSVYDSISCRAKHIIGDSLESRERMRGSKYIKSETRAIFKEIYKNRKTCGVFFGTPCQVAALKNLLGPRAEDWLFIDLICHGVPTSKLWDVYLASLGVSKGAIVKFRDNSLGWSHRNISFTDVKGRELYSCDEFSDNFYRAYKSGVANHDSCLNCPFRNSSSADLRIGDYWDDDYVKNDHPTSMVVVITKKGKEVFNRISTCMNCYVERRSFEDYIKSQAVPLIKKRYYSMRRVKFLEYLAEGRIPLSSLIEDNCAAWEAGEKKEKLIRPFVLAIKRILGK